MRTHWPFWLVLALSALALAASAALLVDYTQTAAPVFCAADGGCGAVRRTALAHPLGVPLPLVGLAGFLAIAFAQMVPGRRARVAQACFAVVGAVAAAAFITVQLVMKAICPFCMTVDVAAIAIGALSLLRARRGWDPPPGRLTMVTGPAVLILAVAVPLGIGFTRKRIAPDVPPPIAAEMRITGNGKVTVVDFVDFECPFCRATHAELAPLLEERADVIRVVRKHVPLRFHLHALDAARAAVCGETMGRGDVMADALFATDPLELTKQGCEGVATKIGLDLDRFRACVADPETEARIKRDSDAFRDAGGQGLPTIWMDGVVLEGAQDRATLAEALYAAIHAR